ncbi:MFS general substrate transporter [Mycena venus]|uniref:MFS general substrate transporter n=1 Tax=Mycena venus TaxID=2733690 RepID=A0A8H7DAN5_9AGAR|nr:MFS general substrate transporter [Mycena venus]
MVSQSGPQPEPQQKAPELAPAPTATTTDAPVPASTKRSARFWLIFVALCFCTLLSALDLGGVGTAAPTIVHDLNGGDFTWVSSAYTLSSAATIPISGNMANIFGRRPILLIGIILFCNWKRSLRLCAVDGGSYTVQGAGGGMVQSLTSIVIADLVSLRERGMYMSITGMIWSVGTAIGPVVTGSLSEKASWRWLFYLNLPLSGVTWVVVLAFLRLHTPRESLWTKLGRVDWLGNAMIIASASACMLALTWGGVRFAWSSPQILAPLILGLCGLVIAQYYESRWPVQPTIPLRLLTNRTSLAGYTATFVQGMVIIGVTFYLPTWFQSVRGATPIASGLYFLPMVMTISPAAIVQSLLVAKTGKYRLINLFGWCFLLLGVGLLISVKANTSIGVLVVCQIIMGVGMGFLYATTFVILAPLDVTDNAAAVALLTFLRIFSQAWGVNIAGAILQNSLQTRIPASLISSLPPAEEIAYTIIPLISSMPQALKTQVQDAFLQSLRNVWIAMAILSGIGLCTLVLIKDLPLRTTTDKKWDTVSEKPDPERALVANAPVEINLNGQSGTAEKQDV